MKRLAFVSAAGLFLLASSPCSYADGGFTVRADHIGRLTEPSQKGLILFQNGREDLVLEVQYQGSAEDFVWLVPVPSRPEVSTNLPDVFGELRRQVATWRPPSAVDPWRVNVSAGYERRHEPRTAIWDYVVLPPERGLLRRWMDEHDLDLSTVSRRVLDRYVRAGWYFVGLSVDPQSLGRFKSTSETRGTIQPVRLRFESKEPVFPLRISSINPGSSDILLYVLSDEALVNRTAAHASWDQWCFGRSAPPAGLDNPWSGSADAPFLTRLTAHFHFSEMTEDVYFRPFDPGRNLKHKDVLHQLGAIAWIGITRDGRWTQRLLAVAGAASSPQVQAALAWTFGRLGDSRPVPWLERLARNGMDSRYEAMRSLLTLDPEKAAQSLLTDLRFPEAWTGRNQRVMRLSFLLDGLLSVPGTSGFASLEEMARSGAGEAGWRDLASQDPRARSVLTPAMMATLILAARGHPASFEAVVAGVARGGEIYARSLKPASRGPTVMKISGQRTVIEMPTIEVVATRRLAGRYADPLLSSAGRDIEDTEWPPLAAVYRILKHQPEARSAILGAAAAQAGLDGVARDVLLGLVPSREPQSLAVLVFPPPD